MKTLRNQDILQNTIQNHVRRLVVRFILIVVVITAWEVLIHSGAFVKLENYIVAGWWGK